MYYEIRFLQGEFYRSFPVSGTDEYMYHIYFQGETFSETQILVSSSPSPDACIIFTFTSEASLEASVLSHESLEGSDMSIQVLAESLSMVKGSHGGIGHASCFRRVIHVNSGTQEMQEDSLQGQRRGRCPCHIRIGPVLC